MVLAEQTPAVANLDTQFCRHGDPEVQKIRDALDHLAVLDEPDLSLLTENVRGLLLAHQLSEGYCATYVTSLIMAGASGKAVAFALPTVSCPRPGFPSLPDLRLGLAQLRAWVWHHPVPGTKTEPDTA
ncbi:hypothetical protein GCM10022226_37430 [Sphaerisporangium flaviroseum]|uniref:Uncharacterized protein n=1 Tax=Sphaerisporangium flaviroseum TaxID=509199 RepID=A0ABP7IA03_9ACTN